MKTIFSILLSILIVTDLAAQDQLKSFPAQISFVYPMGTMGISSPDYEYNFSVNMLVGSVGGIKGFEVGGLMNFCRNSVMGFQAAGIGNKVGGSVVGFQVAGISNMSPQFTGFQAGGVLNMITGDVQGFQAGGVLNTSQNFEGFRVAGVANISGGDTRGMQVAGLVNITKKLEGLQLGVINITDTVVKGISIGVINIYRHGSYNEFEIGISDFANLLASYKYGLKNFYTIYSVGSNFIEDNLWIAGAGFGFSTDKNSKFYLQPEAVYYSYFPTNFRHESYTNLNHVKLGIVFNLHKNLALSINPGLYVSIEKEHNGDYGYEQSMFEPVYEHNGTDSRVEVGYSFGLGLHFK